MPELPEVETTLQGLKPYLEGATIQNVVIRHSQLRWPIPQDLGMNLLNQRIGRLSRRAKYLLLPINQAHLIIHLGMSGSLKIVTKELPAGPHDHVDIIFSNGHMLRYTDPRRFGAILWTDQNLALHPLFKLLGPEPLSDRLNVDYLIRKSHGRRIAVKSFIMDNHVLVGVGNIYATEALYLANIHPLSPAGLLTKAHCLRLIDAIQYVLRKAIKQGGTTLKDFVNTEGKPGYFAQALRVYGRAGQSCLRCQHKLISIKIAGRSTVLCTNCQELLA